VSQVITLGRRSVRPVGVVLAAYQARNYGMAPYGAAALATYLRHYCGERGYDAPCTVVAFRAGEPAPAAADTVLAHHPEVVGLSCYVWNYHQTLELAREIRRRAPGVLVVVGGPHVSRDDRLLAELLDAGVVDHCVLGEGEAAMAALVEDRVLGGRSAGRPFITGGTTDLDTLGTPYAGEPVVRPDLERHHTAIIEGARGCPFSCTFCDQGWRSARLRDLELVKRDLLLVYRLGARRVIFLDPTFNYHHARLAELMRYMREQTPGMTFNAEMKVDLLKPAEIEELADLDVVIEAGLQTSNPDTLRRIRRPEKVDRLWNNVRLLRERGAVVLINTIFGLPGENLDDWLRTVDDCYQRTDAVITATCLKVLPNTEIWNQRFEYGYEWLEADLFRAVRSNHMTPEEFTVAERLARLLAFLQTGEQPIPARLRASIDQTCGGSLSRFLVGFEAGELRLHPDGTIVSAVQAVGG